VDEEAGGKETDSSINVSSDWVNRIDYIPHIIGSKSLSVKYLTLRWISGAPEYEPIYPTYLGVTERDNWRRNEDRPRCKRGQEQVDGEEVRDPHNTSSVLSTGPNTINNQSEHECLDEAVRLLNVNPIHQAIVNRVPGHKYPIPGLPGTRSLVHLDWAIWFIVRRWVWDADIPGALVGDEMGNGKTFTSVAVAMLCKLVTQKVVMGLPLSILCGNTLAEWVILAHNDFPGIVGEEQEWYPLLRLNSVPRRLLEIQTTQPHEHPALISVHEPFLVVTMPAAADTF